MPAKGYKSIAIKEEVIEEIKKKAGSKTISLYLEEEVVKGGKEKNEFNLKEHVEILRLLEERDEIVSSITIKSCRYDLNKAIKGLENDISLLIRDAVKDAFAEMKGY